MVIGQVKVNHLIDTKINFGSQQTTLWAAQLIEKKLVKSHIHKCRLVIMPRRIRQHGYLDLAHTNLGIQFGDEMIGSHCAAYPAPNNHYMLCHVSPPRTSVRSNCCG